MLWFIDKLNKLLWKFVHLQPSAAGASVEQRRRRRHHRLLGGLHRTSRRLARGRLAASHGLLDLQGAELDPDVLVQHDTDLVVGLGEELDALALVLLEGVARAGVGQHCLAQRPAVEPVDEGLAGGGADVDLTGRQRRWREKCEGAKERGRRRWMDGGQKSE